MSVGRYWDAESASSDFAEFTSPKYYWLSGMPNGTDSYERTGTEVAYHTLEYRILIGIAAAMGYTYNDPANFKDASTVRATIIYDRTGGATGPSSGHPDDDDVMQDPSNILSMQAADGLNRFVFLKDHITTFDPYEYHVDPLDGSRSTTFNKTCEVLGGKINLTGCPFEVNSDIAYYGQYASGTGGTAQLTGALWLRLQTTAEIGALDFWKADAYSWYSRLIFTNGQRTAAGWGAENPNG